MNLIQVYILMENNLWYLRDISAYCRKIFYFMQAVTFLLCYLLILNINLFKCFVVLQT